MSVKPCLDEANQREVDYLEQAGIEDRFEGYGRFLEEF